MKKSKKVAIQWAKENKKKDDNTLKELEKDLEDLYSNEGFGFLTEEQKSEVKLLEEKKKEKPPRERERMVA